MPSIRGPAVTAQVPAQGCFAEGGTESEKQDGRGCSRSTSSPEGATQYGGRLEIAILRRRGVIESTSCSESDRIRSLLRECGVIESVERQNDATAPPEALVSPSRYPRPRHPLQCLRGTPSSSFLSYRRQEDSEDPRGPLSNR